MLEGSAVGPFKAVEQAVWTSHKALRMLHTCGMPESLKRSTAPQVPASAEAEAQVSEALHQGKSRAMASVLPSEVSSGKKGSGAVRLETSGFWTLAYFHQRTGRAA